MNRTDQDGDAFEDFFKKYEKYIHYHIHDLDMKDPHNELYVESVCALYYYWKMLRDRAGMDVTEIDVDSVIRVRLMALQERKNG
ncbi:hypothetical protein ACUL41_13405 [Virgibacillus natechei]|uniref:hypothetical protein n=1 Tax=Virgibacillus sp. CBA3643 TaxID=2942278 RepID=UPI0035A3CCD5